MIRVLAVRGASNLAINQALGRGGRSPGSIGNLAAAARRRRLAWRHALYVRFAA